MTPPPFALRVAVIGVVLVAAWLVAPFADSLVLAATAAVLAWPLREAVRARVRPRAVATFVTVLALTIGVVTPIAGAVWLVSRELVSLAGTILRQLDTDRVDAWVHELGDVPVVDWAVAQVGGPDRLAEVVHTAARDGLLGVAAGASHAVPGLVGGTAELVLETLLFLLALVSFVHRGDELGRWALRVSPLGPAHTRRLFGVFQEIGRNVFFAGLVAAGAQGVVAGIGYALAGVERPVFFALLTAVLAIVPLVGTALAWVPIALLLALDGRTGAAGFVVIWSITLTGTVDNFVKPLVVRGTSQLPLLLVFLGVFGGIYAFGVIGLLVGPVLMAMLLALLRIYEEAVAAPGP